MPDMMALRAFSALGSGLVFVTAAPALLLFGYLFITWDRNRADSANKDDGQAGIKLVLLALLVVAIGIAASGVATLLHFLLSGAKTGSDFLKLGIAGLVSGGAVVFGLYFVLFPRTNHEQFPASTRMAAGVLALVGGSLAIIGFHSFAAGLIGGMPWVASAGALATMVAYGAVGFLALNRFGAMSGWTTPVRAVPPQASGGYPQQGGYPPQQGGGYPQQGGGYPQQGGGYPQQGGGYPPQQGGGGYPPQGGGAPPQGGGGLPPPAGGGYPPR